MIKREKREKRDIAAQKYEDSFKPLHIQTPMDKSKDGFIAGWVAREAEIGLERLAEDEESPWQPMATAPKDKRVIVYDPIGHGVTSSVWCEMGFWENCQSPTHWQPLPEPPLNDLKVPKEKQ